LFKDGTIKWDKSPVISIVGTRQLTTYGKRQCKALVAALSVFNPIIVSGLEYGADIIAHKAAIECDLQKVACMAQGLQYTYPAAYKKICSQIEAHGGFVTDFWSTSQFNPSNFIRRNRLIAGLSEAIVVIESAVKERELNNGGFGFWLQQRSFCATWPCR
jgi:DNA processing protein